MRLNAAQKIHTALGVPLKDSGKQAHGNKNTSATKAGPGRVRQFGESGNRITKPRPMRAYRALLAAWAARRVPKWQGPRDDHGVVFLIGKPYALEGVHPTSRELVLEGWVDGDEFGYTVQRKWLAGISAQRGF